MIGYVLWTILIVLVLVAINRYFRGALCTSNNRLDGKTVIITGASSGIGKATALELAKRGARVIMACRSLERGREACLEIISKSKNDKVEVELLNLANTESIRSFADIMHKKLDHLDILINNAAVMMCPKWRTVDGFELQIGVNHLGHFLLTNLLLDLLKNAKSGRIISVASIAHIPGRINWDDINLEKNYNAVLAYSQSKLANILFTVELAKRLRGTSVTAVCLHPGAVRTNITRHMGKTISRFIPIALIYLYPIWWLFSKSPYEGAQTSIHCAVDEDIPKYNGHYFSDCKIKKTSKSASDPKAASKLWEISAKMVKLE